MTNAELLAKIKAEIERMKVDYLNRSYTFVPTAMQQLLDFIYTLESEKPIIPDKEFEVEMDNYVGENGLVNCSEIVPIARHFAQWGAEHLKK